MGSAPPGLEALSFPLGLEPSSWLSSPPGLYSAKVDARGIFGGASDDACVDCTIFVHECQSDTDSTICESDLSAPSTRRSSDSDLISADDVANSENHSTMKLQVDAPEFEPSERTTRTALKTSAHEFKPQMPFVPMAAVENAWQQWHAA